MSAKCTCGLEHPDWIPKQRFDEAQKKERDDHAATTATLTTTTAKLTAAEQGAAAASTLTAALDGYKAKEVSWGEARASRGAGITDADGIEFARHAYARLPAEGRPAISDWLGAKDKLPRGLQAYLPQPAGQQVVVPPPNAGVKPTQAAAPQWSAEQIMAMSPSDWSKQRGLVLGSMGVTVPENGKT